MYVAFFLEITVLHFKNGVKSKSEVQFLSFFYIRPCICNIIYSMHRWNKLIQRPYENGDPRGMRLIKAILRPLMLRRTKETKDKEGR